MALTVAEREHRRFADILSRFGFSDTDDVPLSAVLESALRQLTHENEKIRSAGVTPRVLEPEQVLSWAARLVRIVCFGDLARNVDDEVCEPVRRVALEMRDAAQAVRESVASVPAEQIDAEKLIQRINAPFNEE